MNSKVLIKYITAGKGNYHVDINDHSSVIYAWFIEFCSFVIVMAILIYVDCNLIIDDIKRSQCLSARYKNEFTTGANGSSRGSSSGSSDGLAKDYFLNYYSFMAKIEAPFINKDEFSGKYMIGYIVQKYDRTLAELYRSLNENLDIDAFGDSINLTYQIFEIIKMLADLKNLGITISHRDISPNNIMYTKDPLSKNKYNARLIDFGFLCSSIRFKNGGSIAVGYHPFEKGDMYLCNKRYIDIIFFITECIRYYPQLFVAIENKTKVQAKKQFYMMVTLDQKLLANIFDERICLCDPKSKWKYSTWEYVATLDSRIELLISEGKIPEDCRLDDATLDDIFESVFFVMGEIRDKIIEIYGSYPQSGTEKTDHGNIKTFYIADISANGGLEQFYNIYEKNKYAYLQLNNLSKV